MLVYIGKTKDKDSWDQTFSVVEKHIDKLVEHLEGYPRNKPATEQVLVLTSFKTWGKRTLRKKADDEGTAATRLLLIKKVDGRPPNKDDLFNNLGGSDGDDRENDEKNKKLHMARLLSAIPAGCLS